MVEKRDMVSSLGVTTHDTSGSRSVNSANDSRNFIKSKPLFDFGLEGSRKAGVSCVTFVTPQALFCARDKAQERTEILYTRGENNGRQTPPSPRPRGIHPQKIQTFFRKPLEIASHAGYCTGKELENSDYASGRCFRQGNKSPHLHLRSFGLVEGCTRKDRRTSCIVFSTSASPFLCPRENGSKKQSITFMQGGKHGRQTPPSPRPRGIHPKKISTFFRKPLEIASHADYCTGNGLETPSNKRRSLPVNGGGSRYNSRFLGLNVPEKSGLDLLRVFQRVKSFFVVLETDGGKDSVFNQTCQQGGLSHADIEFQIRIACPSPRAGAVPQSSDLVLFPHLGRIQNQEKSIRSNRARRSGNRGQGGDLFVHRFPAGQRVAQARNQIHSPAQLPAKGEVTWTTRNLSSLRQSPLFWLSPRSSSPSSQSFRNQYRRKHSMTRLCSKITTSSSIIAKEILKTAALSLFGAAIGIGAMVAERLLR